MRHGETSGRVQLARRDFLGAGPLVAQQPAAPMVERVKGPPVWLDMDGVCLCAADAGSSRVYWQPTRPTAQRGDSTTRSPKNPASSSIANYYERMGTLTPCIIRVARYTWALPATFVGLLLSLLAFCIGATGRMVEGAIEIAGGRIARCLLMLPRCCHFGAITFGHVIIGVDHATLARCRLHEHVHIRQYERWGVLFFPLYLSSSLLELVRGRDPYLDNSFEREAFEESARRWAL